MQEAEYLKHLGMKVQLQVFNILSYQMNPSFVNILIKSTSVKQIK